MGKPLENGDVMGIKPDLVGGLELFLMFPYIENHHPNWLSYFSEGVETTNQYSSFGVDWLPSGCVKMAIENGHRNSGFTHW